MHGQLPRAQRLAGASLISRQRCIGGQRLVEPTSEMSAASSTWSASVPSRGPTPARQVRWHGTSRGTCCPRPIDSVDAACSRAMRIDQWRLVLAAAPTGSAGARPAASSSTLRRTPVGRRGRSPHSRARGWRAQLSSADSASSSQKSKPEWTITRRRLLGVDQLGDVRCVGRQRARRDRCARRRPTVPAQGRRRGLCPTSADEVCV